MRFWWRLTKKAWNGFLDAVAWVTQDNDKLRQVRRKTNPRTEQTLVHAISRFFRF